MPGTLPSSGWYPDPSGRHRLRFWSGSTWTDWVADSADAFRQARRPRRSFEPSRSPLALALVVAASVSTLLTVWWLVGDLTEHNRSYDVDYLVRVPHVPAAATTFIGVIALAMLVATATALVAVVMRHRISAAWAPPATALVAAGALLALVERSVTAGSVGANIGGGMALLFMTPIAAALCWFAVRDLSILMRRGA